MCVNSAEFLQNLRQMNEQCYYEQVKLYSAVKLGNLREFRFDYSTDQLHQIDLVSHQGSQF